MSKAIYKPKGKAKEYAHWACNLYVGCSNDCTYCYCKRGALGTVMGRPKAMLKSCFKDEDDAFRTFVKELMKNREEIIRDGGLFFSFSTDPCLKETIRLTITCIGLATGAGVPCSILTKRADWVLEESDEYTAMLDWKELVSIGFSFSGWDAAEPGASSENDRITAMKKLHEKGIRTFASFEPMLSLPLTQNIVRKILPFCDEFKFGLLSGTAGKTYMYNDINHLRLELSLFVKRHDVILKAEGKRVYWKKSIVALFGQQNFDAITVPVIDDNEYAVLFALQGRDSVEGLLPEEIASKARLTGKEETEALCVRMKEKGLLDDFHPKGHPKTGAFYPTYMGQAAMKQKRLDTAQTE